MPVQTQAPQAPRTSSAEAAQSCSNRDVLFRPFTVKSLTLPNRIVMAPMGMSNGVNGVPQADYIEYYRRRAAGGIGLILTGATAIPHPSAPIDLNEPHFHGEAAIDRWRQSLRAVHDAGGRIIPQLWHSGLQALAQVQPKWRQLGPSGIWYPPLDAQGRAGTPEVRGEPMTQQEIDTIIDAFGTAVTTAKDLGFDGAEIHGGHGFLIDQFFWDKTNRRTDGYGGDIAARTRFAVEVITECRRRVGPDFPLLMRISQFKMMDYEARLADTPQDLQRFIEPLAAAGIDLFDCSQRRFAQAAFADSPLNFAGWVKKLSGKPTICCGGVGLAQNSVEFGTPNTYGTTASPSVAQLDQVCEMMSRGDFDLVSMARAILGDPAWAAKVQSGAEHELTPFTAELMLKLIP